jgi:hypothetical protein
MLPYMLVSEKINRHKARILDYTEAKSKLIDALYGEGHCRLFLSNMKKRNYILLLRIYHPLPDSSGSWIIPLINVPDDIARSVGKKPMKITEAIKLFEEYHG